MRPDRALAPVDAEADVLGSLLHDVTLLAKVRPILRAAVCFSVPDHQRVFAAICSIADRGDPVDHVTMWQELENVGLENPQQLLADLVEMHVTTANVEHHAETVLDAFQRRHAIAEAERIVKLAHDPAVKLTDAIAESSTRLTMIPQERERDEKLASTLYRVMESIESRYKAGEEIRGISTGIPGLDELMDGFEPGGLTILAARPSRGKSSVGMHMVRHVANVGPAIVNSLEMSREQLLERMLGAEAGCNMRWITKRKYAGYFDRHVGGLSIAAGRLARLPIYFHDLSGIRPCDLRLQIVGSMARGITPKLIAVDYLGLMHPDDRQENRNNDVGQISGALKRIAREFGIHVLALHQLSRANERENRKPTLADLRDSGNLEQDADNVILLHWPEPPSLDPVTGDDHDHRPDAVDLLLPKARNGQVGSVPMCFDRRTQRWWEPRGDRLALEEPALT